MGADPAALEEALYRDVKRRDELDRQTACEGIVHKLSPGRAAGTGKKVRAGT